MAVAVARVGEIPPGQSKKFLLDCAGREFECFLINYGGELHAYVNQCRHIPMGLDWVENQFFTDDGRFVQCATHGAYYVPETGECVAGPPCGKSLVRVRLRVENGAVLAECPVTLPND